jgi:hypothetical protein
MWKAERQKIGKQAGRRRRRWGWEMGMEKKKNSAGNRESVFFFFFLFPSVLFLIFKI